MGRSVQTNPTEYLHTFIASSCATVDGSIVATHDSNLRARFGGQLEDMGSLYLNGWHRISDVIGKDGRRMFAFKGIQPSFFPVNTPVVLRLDVSRRLRISAMHTAIHLLCGLTGNKVIRGYAGPDASRVEFVGDASEFNGRHKKINELFADCVNSRLLVEVIFANREELLNYGKVEEVGKLKQDSDEGIRIVNIQGVDLRACNGTHVNNTGALNAIHFDKATSCETGRFTVRLTNRSLDKGFGSC
jgi:misacylated tRNA(Ala) deacylase